MNTIRKRRNSTYADSFIRGIGSLLSVFSGFNDSRVQAKLCLTDRESLASDWKAIGNDVRRSVKSQQVK